MRSRVPSGQRLLASLFLATLLLTSCSLVPEEGDPAEGGRFYNDTDRIVFIYAEMSSGGDIMLGAADPGSSAEMEGPCQDRALFAKHTADGPIIDTWDTGLCAGDYWSVPSGGLVENHTDRPILVWAIEPGSGSSYAITIGAGRTGSLRALCADPPITAGSETFEAPTRQDPLCVGDVWVIEEP